MIHSFWAKVMNTNYKVVVEKKKWKFILDGEGV